MHRGNLYEKNDTCYMGSLKFWLRMQFIGLLLVPQIVAAIMFGGLTPILVVVIGPIMEELYKFLAFKYAGCCKIWIPTNNQALLMGTLFAMNEFIVNIIFNITAHWSIVDAVMLRLSALGMHMATISVYYIWSQGVWPKSWPHPILVGLLLHMSFNYWLY